MIMKYVLRKASDYNFMEIVDYNLEQINSLAFSESVIIGRNLWFNVHDIEKRIDKPAELCNIIKQTPLQIMIYDAYIE